MRIHAQTTRLAAAVLAALIGACGGSGQSAKTAASAEKSAAKPAEKAAMPEQLPLAKTQALPADGGEVGKAYNELVAAYQTLDSARANQLLDHYGAAAEPLKKEVVDPMLPDMLKVHPVGGLRQGDRATLFLGGGTWHGSFSASLVSGHWEFDSANPSAGQEDPRDPGPDCKTQQYFPCRAWTFPDAQVSGGEKAYRKAPNNSFMPASGVLFDGYAVRMLDPKTKALRYTQIVLSSAAFEPHAFATQADTSYLQSGSLWLSIAPDNKTAKLIFVNSTPGDQHPEVDATQGLSLDTSTPNRLRGHLKLDAKDLAQFDVTFDVSTASECLADAERCGNE